MIEISHDHKHFSDLISNTDLLKLEQSTASPASVELEDMDFETLNALNELLEANDGSYQQLEAGK